MEELIAIDAQLTRLEELNPRLARVVECRFSGMSIEETALALIRRCVNRRGGSRSNWLARASRRPPRPSTATLERWREVEALFNAACSSSSGRVAELLAQAKPEVRREVALLAQESATGRSTASPSIS